MSYRGSTSSISGLSSAAALAKAPTPLEQLLEEINFQRTKEMRQLLKDDSGFVMLQGTTYWTDLFVRHFLFQTDHCIDCDDLLFFVRKKHIKSSSRLLPKFDTEVDVFRKASRKLPIGDPDMDWEETVYLNLIIHQFDYTLTLAICTRTSPKELQVLRRHSQKVYASPSRRRMDTKAEVEEMTYPNVCFMVDNFNEVFCDIMVRDGEMVCVELVASDRDGAIQGVIFLGSIRYDALKRVYDARSSLSSKMAQRMTFGLFSNASSQRVEFVRMKGPQGKGHAEMAVTKPKGYSGAETPTSEPGYCATDMWDSDWDSDPEEFFVYRHQRRLSDPSANIHNFVRGGWKTKPAETAGSKARSENEGLDSLANGLSEIEAGDLRDDCEFCVHSITTDASTPMGNDQTVENADNSVAKSSSKRLTPACSIISSFFPSCKLKSKYPDRAVPCLSELNELACSTADLVLSESAEDPSACTLAASSQLSQPQTASQVNFVSVNDFVCEPKKSNDVCDQEEQGQVDSSNEQRNDSSDEEFEDCASFGNDCSTISQGSNLCVDKSRSESIEELWSDAEDEPVCLDEKHPLILQQSCDPAFVIHESDSIPPKSSQHISGNMEHIPHVSDEVITSTPPEELLYKNQNVEERVVEGKCCHGIKMSSLCLLCYRLGRTDLDPNSGIKTLLLHPRQEKPINVQEETSYPNVLEECDKHALYCASQKKNFIINPVNLDVCDCQHDKKSFSQDGLCHFASGKPKKVSSFSHTLPSQPKSQANSKRNRDVIPPHKVASDGTSVYYWCDVPGGNMYEPQTELDDGAYNPLWTMRGFTQTFHFWKENKRAQSVPLNAFLTYITLPWWSIVRDILDHRESPILTF